MYLFQLNLRADHDYQPGTWDGRITYFRGKDGLPEDPAAFWSEITMQGVDVHSVPGRGVGALADALKVTLKNAREASISGYAVISSDQV